MAGHRYVVALIGSAMSDQQAAILAAHFSRAVLMLDGAVIAGRLCDRRDVAVINLGEAMQADQLASKEIAQLVGGYCPWKVLDGHEPVTALL